MEVCLSPPSAGVLPVLTSRCCSRACFKVLRYPASTYHLAPTSRVSVCLCWVSVTCLMCLISVCVFVPLSGIYPLSASKESRKKLEMWCTLVCFYFWFGVLNCPLLLRWLVEISVLEVFLLSECWTQGKKVFPDILTHILRFLCYFRSLGMWDELYPINIYVCAGLVKKEHEKFPLSLQGWPPAVTIAYRAQLAQFLQCSEKVFVPYWFLCYLVCLFFCIFVTGFNIRPK